VKVFTDKVAVVTGAASGIGAGIAEVFAAAGMKVVLSDVATDALEQTTHTLRATGEIGSFAGESGAHDVVVIGCQVTVVVVDVDQIDAFVTSGHLDQARNERAISASRGKFHIP
jgi:NAD(P)-dependent dehydrogenase (short-subunit alcohol dehydrogenase family)